MEEWKSGRVEEWKEWKSGRVEEVEGWKSGGVEGWKSGRVEEWKGGTGKKKGCAWYSTAFLVVRLVD